MRTRFLPSNDAVSGGGAPIEALDFFHFPPPQFPPPENPSLFIASLLNNLDQTPFPDNVIGKLPIDDPLSIFLSGVLPDFMSFCDCELDTRCSDGSKENYEYLTIERSAETSYGVKQAVRLGSDGKLIQDKDDASSDNECWVGIEFMQFEIPKMDLFLLSLGSETCSLGHSHIFSEISETEDTIGVPQTELTLCNQLEILQSICSVDDMNTDYSVEEKSDLFEDGSSIQAEQHSHDFPHFEVDEESMGIVGKIHTVDDFLCYDDIQKEKLAQPGEDSINNRELLGYGEFDFIKDLLHTCAVNKWLEDADFSSRFDYLKIIDVSDLQEVDDGKRSDSFWSRSSLFDEFLFFDLDLYNSDEVFLSAAKHMESEVCVSMFGEAMNFKNLNELIVSHELTLMDDSFKSLPVPICLDQGLIRSFHLSAEELLEQLEWQTASASDGLYLDWHYLAEDGSQMINYSSCWKMLWDIDTYIVDAASNLSDSERLILDFILCEDDPNKQNAENNKEMLSLPTSDAPVLSVSRSDDHVDESMISEDFLKKSCVEKGLMSGKSMSSDLEFFLNPRINITGRDNKPENKSVNTSTVSQVLMPSDDFTAAKSSTVVQQKWNMKLQYIKLSNNIILLVDYLQKHFLALLENDKELIQMQNLHQPANDLTLLQITKETLISRVKDISSSSTYTSDNDDHVMVLSVLYAIKQMAFYLCYYGIQAAFLYIDNLIRDLRGVKSRLSFLYKVFRDEHEKSEKELSMVHPAISAVQEILQTNSKNNASKFLIVADQLFWSPLERLMTSLKMSYNKPQHQGLKITDSAMDVMLLGECWLVSHDYISASFPFSKFSIVLEYGGSEESSRVSSISHKLDMFPTLYFLKVELEEPISMALTDGINQGMKKDIGSTLFQQYGKSKLEEILNALPVKGADDNEQPKYLIADKDCTVIPLHSIPINGKSKLEEILNALPVKGADVNEQPKSLIVDEDCTVIPVHSKPICFESKQNLTHKPSFPDSIIIVNTQNFKEEMVISRRSTYLKVIEMEKEGIQVVERDISLPVDLIVSASVSLTWYDIRNIGKKASAPDEAFSCLPLCVESIAANVLTSLSFAFSCCILIFEGEGSFLSSIMESSDELYAAAASLGIELQLFCSYSFEMTEEIMKSCINVAVESSKGLYTKMSDSESLAESFLTSFPSFNPLSAHAILCSGDVLGKFLESSKSGRVCSLEKYQVPVESISLGNATSRYGKQEDSKSEMTDCSSSMSSVPDSENIRLRTASERKRPRYAQDLFNAAEPLNKMMSSNPLPDDSFDFPRLSIPENSFQSGHTDVSKNPVQLYSSYDDELLNWEDFNANGFEIVAVDRNGFDMSGDMDKTRIPLIDVDVSPEKIFPAPEVNNFGWQSVKLSDHRQDNFIGEVIDVENSPSYRKTIKDLNSGDFSMFLLDLERDSDPRNPAAKETYLHSNNFQAYTNSDCDTWISRGDTGQILREEVEPSFATTERNFPLSCQRGLVRMDMMQKDPQSSSHLAMHSLTKSSADTPLSKALHSNQKQESSPWTIEFLNRIREKSRLRQLSVPHNLSSPNFGLPGNSSKVTKRKSPSIFELYKYEGRTPSKVVDKRKANRTSQPVNTSKNEKAYASSQIQLTPIDKRARRTLSFSSNGGGGQSKLIWADNISHFSTKHN